MERFINYPAPVLVPQYDRVAGRGAGFIVLRIPTGVDRQGRPLRDVSLTRRQARAILDHLSLVEAFAGDNSR